MPPVVRTVEMALPAQSIEMPAALRSMDIRSPGHSTVQKPPWVSRQARSVSRSRIQQPFFSSSYSISLIINDQSEKTDGDHHLDLLDGRDDRYYLRR
jgi:hypothetical protein